MGLESEVMTDPTDRTTQLFGTHPEYLADNAIVILSAAQLSVLKRFLDDLAALGPGLKFVIERCVDENPGYNFSWDNDGTREQDDLLENRIAKLCEDLGFHR